MGIPGLLPALKDFTKNDSNIRDWKGKAIAVDTSCWLHKAVYSVADVHVQATEAGKVDPQAVRVASRFLSQRCNELIIHAGISKLFLVLDGQQRCPLKSVTHEERQRRRAVSLEQARQAQSKQAAFEKYKACIHISHQFTQAVLHQLRQDKLFREGRIILVQAPHEADAQLIHLEKSGHVQAIITEDSDVLVYAVAARSEVTVLYKFNRHTGACQAICMDWLWSRNVVEGETTSTGQGKPKATQQQVWRTLQSRERSDPGAGRRLFVQACVLTGCDYAPNELPGIGLIKAFQLLIMDIAYLPADKRFESVVRGRLTPRSAVDAYATKLKQAEAVFYYHPVRPIKGRLSWLTGSVRQTCSPDFPANNLAILGDPAHLKHLPLPREEEESSNCNLVSNVVTLEAELSQSNSHGDESSQFDLMTNKNPSTEEDTLIDILARASKPAPISTTFIDTVRNRQPPVNPYRKRPLEKSSSPHQSRKTSVFNGSNPFARFRRATEKENTQSTTTRSEDATPPSVTLDPPKQPEHDAATVATDNSSVASPSSDTTRSPFFASRKCASKGSSETYENASNHVSQGEKKRESAPFRTEEISKPADKADFYDEWLSPKKRELQDDVIEIAESPPSLPKLKVQPVAPQGMLRFRFGGLMTNKRPMISQSKALSRNSLASKQRKLVYRPSRKSGTLLDHFRTKTNH